jgi:circadian clock protein KaiB
VTSYRFRLYVLGETVRAHAALEQLRSLCARAESRYEIEVIDLHENPEIADQARIVATPTLDRLRPAPLIRVIGDLSSDELAMALQLPLRPDLTKDAPNGQ